jgi:hypothetical protein
LIHRRTTANCITDHGQVVVSARWSHRKSLHQQYRTTQC